uniref:Uncharacterized protein n=1 Tax=Cannabis sativa TaxID=3483 RepID=A0A803PLH8_CANSA
MTQPEGGPGKRTTRSRRTRNQGIGYEEPKMNIGRAHSRPTGDDGAYDPTRYVRKQTDRMLSWNVRRPRP